MLEIIQCGNSNQFNNFEDDIFSDFWKDFPIYSISRFMGKKPLHFPKTQFQMVYNDIAIFVFFTVEDRFIISRARQYQGEVWKDSCVEFFFTPGTNINSGYFNLEINCSGQALFCFQKSRGVNVQPILENYFKKVEIFHSIKGPVLKENIEPVTWKLAFKLPLNILKNYTRISKPEPGNLWRANFYKCADSSSHPHWLTWAKIDKFEPDFHRPEYFGTIRFE